MVLKGKRAINMNFNAPMATASTERNAAINGMTAVMAAMKNSVVSFCFMDSALELKARGSYVRTQKESLVFYLFNWDNIGYLLILILADLHNENWNFIGFSFYKIFYSDNLF